MFCFPPEICSKNYPLFSPGQVLFKFILCFCFCILFILFCLTHLIRCLLLFIPHFAHLVVHLYLCSLYLLYQAHSAPGLAILWFMDIFFLTSYKEGLGIIFKIGISIGKLGWKITPLLTHLVWYNLNNKTCSQRKYPIDI